MRRTLVSTFVAVVVALLVWTLPRTALAKGEPWCADGIEALPNDVCYLDGSKADKPRTLVVFLHGMIGKDTNWSHNHEKMMLRVAKATNIEIVFPKAPLGELAYAWPGTIEAQEKSEQALIDQWMTAKAVLEKRGKPFEHVFVMGFSSGAYFASSLAMRGRVDVDGYAVFAGGQALTAPAAPVVKRAPVYVGVCAKDPTGTAKHARAFAGSLAAAGIPRMVSEQQVGHDLSDVHFVQALAYLRRMAPARETPKA